ncbi:MAG: hypothetical protein RL726_498, partial [Actinomycetota bacterium]
MIRRAVASIAGAISIIGLAVIPVRPVVANDDAPTTDVSNPTMITSLVVERLPGRTSLAAQSAVEY